MFSGILVCCIPVLDCFDEERCGAAVALHHHGRKALLIAGHDALNFAILGRWLDAVPNVGNSVDALVTRSMMVAAGFQGLVLVNSRDINRKRNSAFRAATSRWNSRLTILGIFVDALFNVPGRRIVPIINGIQSNLGNLVIGTRVVGHDVVLLAGRIFGTSHVTVLLTHVVEQGGHGVVGTDVQSHLHGRPHGRCTKGRGDTATMDAVPRTAVAGQVAMRSLGR